MRRQAWVLTLALGIGILMPIAVADPGSARGGLPTLWIYPSTDCPGSLQGCVDAAGPGDTIEIRSSDALGDISFSVYLWHWPFLVLGESRLPEDWGHADKVSLLLVMTLVASVLSYLLV